MIIDECPLCGSCDWKIPKKYVRRVERECVECGTRFIVQKYESVLESKEADHVGDLFIKVRLEQ